jgi:hypothetical protein
VRAGARAVLDLPRFYTNQTQPRILGRQVNSTDSHRLRLSAAPCPHCAALSAGAESLGCGRCGARCGRPALPVGRGTVLVALRAAVALGGRSHRWPRGSTPCWLAASSSGSTRSSSRPLSPAFAVELLVLPEWDAWRRLGACEIRLPAAASRGRAAWRAVATGSARDRAPPDASSDPRPARAERPATGPLAGAETAGRNSRRSARRRSTGSSKTQPADGEPLHQVAVTAAEQPQQHSAARGSRLSERMRHRASSAAAVARVAPPAGSDRAAARGRREAREGGVAALYQAVTDRPAAAPCDHREARRGVARVPRRAKQPPAS